MGGKVNRGLDYTPLFRFLISRVDLPWNDTYSEAIFRLDRVDPIYWLVARNADETSDVVRCGESSYFSGLYIDSSNILRKVNPSLGPDNQKPKCKCCTHTFNGLPFTQVFTP
jgi:hypothetical protein